MLKFLLPSNEQIKRIYFVRKLNLIVLSPFIAPLNKMIYYRL